MKPLETILEEVESRIAAACARAGRDPADVEIVAVTKTHGAEVVQEAWNAGLRIVGVVQNQTVNDSSMSIDWAFYYLKPLEGDMEKKIDFDAGKVYISNAEITYYKTKVEEMLKEGELLGYHLHIGDCEENVDAYVLRDGKFYVDYKTCKGKI